jgi:DNA polymerase I
MKAKADYVPESTKVDYIILDCANLAYRAFYGFKGTTNHKPAMYGVLRDIINLTKMFHTDNFLFCFDGTPTARQKLYKPYKANRTETPDRSRVQKEIKELRIEVLPRLGYTNILWREDCEADDLIGFLWYQLTGSIVSIVSCDSDLYQLVDPKTTIWNPITKMSITQEWIYEQHKVWPCEWALLKAISGCDSDNIKGVDGIGHVSAANYIRNTLPDTSARWKRINSPEGLEIIERNRKLVTLPFCELPPVILPIQQQTSIYGTMWDHVMENLGMNNLSGKFP